MNPFIDVKTVQPLYDLAFELATRIIIDPAIVQHAPMLIWLRFDPRQGGWGQLGRTVLEMEDEDDKNFLGAIFTTLRKHADLRDCFVFIVEGWKTEIETTGLTFDQQAQRLREVAGKVSEQPDAQEVLQFLFFGRGFDMQAICPIKRGEGEKRALEKATLTDLSAQLAAGRFMEGNEGGGEHGAH